MRRPSAARGATAPLTQTSSREAARRWLSLETAQAARRARLMTTARSDKRYGPRTFSTTLESGAPAVTILRSAGTRRMRRPSAARGATAPLTQTSSRLAARRWLSSETAQAAHPRASHDDRSTGQTCKHILIAEIVSFPQGSPEGSPPTSPAPNILDNLESNLRIGHRLSRYCGRLGRGVCVGCRPRDQQRWYRMGISSY
jgi:hypothetical protein